MDVFEAASGGDLERVRGGVEQEPGIIHVEDDFTRTLLSCAAGAGHMDVVRYLLDAGANVNQCNRFQMTALHHACTRGHAEIVSLLLQSGADPHARAEGGRTALILAAAHVRAAVVRVLLEDGGSNVDTCEPQGSTAMHPSCYNGHSGVVRQLLEAGGDPTPRSMFGRTALDDAEDNHRQACVRILQHLKVPTGTWCKRTASCSNAPSSQSQEWDRAYLLQRVRHLRDASSKASSPHAGAGLVDETL